MPSSDPPSPLNPQTIGLRVTITIVRAERPLSIDPAHPEGWTNETQRRILESRLKYEAHDYVEIEPAHFSAGNTHDLLQLPSGQTVALNTSRLGIDLTWSNEIPGQAKLGIEACDPTMDCADLATKWWRPAIVTDDAAHREFEIELQPNQWDSPYAKTSLWAFRWVYDTGVSGVEAGVLRGNVVVTIEAYRLA